jgi:hypothetical protein
VAFRPSVVNQAASHSLAPPDTSDGVGIYEFSMERDDMDDYPWKLFLIRVDQSLPDIGIPRRYTETVGTSARILVANCAGKGMMKMAAPSPTSRSQTAIQTQHEDGPAPTASRVDPNRAPGAKTGAH